MICIDDYNTQPGFGMRVVLFSAHVLTLPVHPFGTSPLAAAAEHFTAYPFHENINLTFFLLHLHTKE
jgi:hypothetical protein